MIDCKGKTATGAGRFAPRPFTGAILWLKEKVGTHPRRLRTRYYRLAPAAEDALLPVVAG